jgi:uncharacterized YigZ family protein
MYTYKTIVDPTVAEYKEKGSTFIGFAYPIVTKEEAMEHVSHLKYAHPKAVHHCFAYRIGLDESDYRISDDGEPSGTAGRPIYNAILSKELTNILVVVVRYYGGIKLGVSGLIKAYKSPAVEAIALSSIIQKEVKEVIEIEISMDKYAELMPFLKKNEGLILKTTFDTKYTLEIEIGKSKIEWVRGLVERY